MNNQHFLIFGSLLAFYIPMVIMVTTYVLTVHHLKSQKLSSLTGARHQISKNGSLAVSEHGANHQTATGRHVSKFTYHCNIASTETSHRCCKLLLSRATQTPSDITREIQLTTRKELLVVIV